MQKILEVKSINKTYKIYKSNVDRLKELLWKKSYHKEHISNQNISFDLYAGETLGIIGVNGAGKSTLLKMIAGVVVPTSGEIIRQGRVTALLELGTGFNPELSGYENIYLNGTLVGMTHREITQKIDEIIAFSELGVYIDECIKTYSSGMLMRLAFSIALFSEPQIFIVDEALSVGDAHFSQKCIDALKKRKKQQMSIIYVSHDLNSLKLLTDRMILLHQGKNVKEGSPEEVINHYNFLIASMDNTNDSSLVTKKINDAFGTFLIKILHVSIKGETSLSNTLTSGENATIEVALTSSVDAKNITVGIIIKDRFGQDIFGTNTYFHDYSLDFKANQTLICKYHMQMNIGVGIYTITAAVHSKESHLEHCYHWQDNAAQFEVLTDSKQHSIGLCKLYPRISHTQEEKR